MELDEINRSVDPEDPDNEDGAEIEIRGSLDTYLNDLNEKRELQGKSEITLADYYKDIKNHAPIADAHKQFAGGKLTYKHSLGEDLDQKEFKN